MLEMNHSPNLNENTEHVTLLNENGKVDQTAMNSAPITNGPGDFKRGYALLLGIIILKAIICCIVGAVLLIICMYEEPDKIVKDYTDCLADELPNPSKCKDSLNTTGKECTCYIELEIKELLKAPVTVFYELDSYEQISSSYAQSRDDNQLAGHLSQEPSASCGSYTYANTEGEKKPIAPCGQLADALFNDTFTLQTNNDYILNVPHGLISEADKKQFGNPPGNLTQAFKNFSKPINWRKEVYELDTYNPDNNGFLMDSTSQGLYCIQNLSLEHNVVKVTRCAAGVLSIISNKIQNEAFIIWMNTDLTPKPAWRVNHTGKYKDGVFPANYTLRVTYGYPPSRYDGRRKFIISSVHRFNNSQTFWWGVALLVFGVLYFVLVAVILYFREISISRLWDMLYEVLPKF